MTTDEWSDRTHAVRTVMDSRLVAVVVFVVLGGFFCTVVGEGFNKGWLPWSTAILLLHAGLFLSMAGASTCFSLAGWNATRLSRSFLVVWLGLIIIAFFEFGWIMGVVAVLLSVAYFFLGKWIASLMLGGLFVRFTRLDSRSRDR